MPNLEKEPDSIINPADALTEDMKLEETSNDTDHNQFTRGDEINLVGDGIPGYETTGEDGTDDDTEDQIEQNQYILNPNNHS